MLGVETIFLFLTNIYFSIPIMNNIRIIILMNIRS